MFDLCHTEYDNRNAQEIEAIPVITVHMRTDTRFKTTKTDEQVEKTINSQVAECHNLHGYDQTLPLEEDHRNGNVPDFQNPRMLVEQ